ncbi:hypothetical protein ES703_71686 [subsurface metagenome]
MSVIRKFLNWFTRKNDKAQLKEPQQAIPETPPPKLQIRTVQDLKAATRIKTFQDIRAFCREVRKTLTIYKKCCQQILDISWTHKKAIDSLYVEFGNLSDKINTLIKSQKGEDDV